MTGPATATDPFPARLTWALAAIGAVCLLGSIVSLFLPSHRTGETAGADSTSRSALGHRAFVDLLRTQGIPVIVSRHATARRAADASLLMLIEPLESEIGDQGRRLANLVEHSKCPVLVVLPKRRPVEAPGRPPRLVAAPMRAEAEVTAVLRPVASEASLVRPSLAPAEGWTARSSLMPELTDPQLVGAGGWSPLIQSSRGFLAAERKIDGARVAILSDPDLVANHGLHRGSNAALAVDLVRSLRDGDRPVLLDETLHGLEVPSSFWAQLFEFPLALATIQAALAAALLLWAGMRRFGPPEAAPLPYQPGKAFLIAHTARLLEAGGHHVESLVRYAELVSEDAARRLPAHGRGATAETLAGLESEVAGMTRTGTDARTALRVAGRLDRLRQEIVHGSDVRPGAR